MHQAKVGIKCCYTRFVCATLVSLQRSIPTLFNSFVIVDHIALVWFLHMHAILFCRSVSTKLTLNRALVQLTCTEMSHIYTILLL